MAYLGQIEYALYEFNSKNFDDKEVNSIGHQIFMRTLLKYVDDKVYNADILNLLTCLEQDYAEYQRSIHCKEVYKHRFLEDLNNLVYADNPKVSLFFIQWFKISPIDYELE